jgi:glycosyltransferase involved in cell wall biosynthesis
VSGLVQLRAPLHVLTITPFYPRLDAPADGCFVAEPLPWLEAAGICNTVMAVQPRYRGSLRLLPTAPAANAVNFWCLPGGLGLSTSGAFLFARLVGEVRGLHQRQPIDLIHAHSALPCGHAAVLLGRELGIPFVVSVHGRDAYSTRQVTGRAGQWCRSVSRMVYEQACQVVCVSALVADEVLRGAPGARAAVIYNGVDISLFQPGPPADSPPVVLSVGNLIPTKAHQTLLRAFAEVLNEIPGTMCELIGEGPERARLHQLAAELGVASHVRFRGRLDRAAVADAMRRCSVFALPSTYEGLGCVYLEAMACGKIAIGCRGQGIEEVIQDRANGLLVEPDQVSGLSDALTLALTDSGLRTQMEARARGTVLAGLTLEHQTAHMAGVYRSCAS